MWKFNKGSDAFSDGRRQIRDWMWRPVLIAYIYVPTVWFMAQFVNFRSWLTPDGADVIAALTMLITVVAVTALGFSCYMGIFAALAKWLGIEQHPVGKAIITAADALDISSSRDAAQFFNRCRSAIRTVGRRSPYVELGAIGNLKAALAHSQGVTKGHRGQGRQAGAAPRSKAGTKSADDEGDGGGDGEPPRQLFYTYTSFSKLFGIAPQTLRNKVSAGLFLAPVHTVFGPRFTQQHIDFALNPPKQADVFPHPGRGRPRIARGLGKGGAQ